jgi:hypothetical protein
MRLEVIATLAASKCALVHRDDQSSDDNPAATIPSRMIHG